MTKAIKKAIVTILLLCVAFAFACFAACDFTQSSETPTNPSQQEQTENADKNNGTNDLQNGETPNDASGNQNGDSQSGSEQSPKHACSFVIEKAEEKYLKSAATCTEKAVYYKSCSCGEKGTETFECGEAKGHDYGEWKNNENGTHTKTCSHDSTHTITENCHGGTATCTEQATCEDCNAKYGTALGHSYTNYVNNNNATCESNATETAMCDHGCETSDTKTVENSALGHDYGTPTYSWDGNKCTATRVCARDNAHKESETVTAEYVKDTDATCTMSEKGHYKAMFKNSAFATQTTEKDSVINGETKGHSYTNYVSDNNATCESNATETAMCDHGCGTSDTRTIENSALGHDYGEWKSNGDGTHTKTCKNDSTHTVTESCHGGNATCTEKATCEDCNTKYGTTNDQHNYENGVCKYCSQPYYSEGLIFTLLSNGTYSVKKGSFNGTELVIPSSYKGKLVTSIGSCAFYNCSSLVSVTIPNSVTSIGSSAFKDCNSIENIYYNGDINDWVQKGISNLMVYGKSSKKLYINGKLLTEANITNATKINDYAFSGCSSLVSVTIPNSVTSIGSCAFDGCSSLVSITIPNSVTSIGSCAFA